MRDYGIVPPRRAVCRVCCEPVDPQHLATALCVTHRQDAVAVHLLRKGAAMWREQHFRPVRRWR
jgi:hypothetical protein